MYNFLNFFKKITSVFYQFFNKKKLITISLPNKFILPLENSSDVDKLKIFVGTKVLRGQLLTKNERNIFPIHAPTSGFIESICSHTLNISYKKKCIVLIPDGLDTWILKKKVNNFQNLKFHEIIKKISSSGILNNEQLNVLYNTKLKIPLNNIHTLIINTAECEPYVTFDSYLIQKYAKEILKGIDILSWILKLNVVFIAVEKNQIQIINILNKLLIKKKSKIFLYVFPKNKRPYKNLDLIKMITGKKTTFKKDISELGVLIYNVHIMYLIKRVLIDGEPFTENIVTFFSKSTKAPYYVLCRIGTPIHHILSDLGYNLKKNVIVINKKENYIISNIQTPVSKYTKSIFIPPFDKKLLNEKEKPCIRCDICSDVCPVQLFPQELYAFINDNNHKKSKTYGIEYCIECGICSYVCPSNIPLVQYFHTEKLKIKVINNDIEFSKKSKIRFEARKNRLLNNFKEKNVFNIDTSYKLKVAAAIKRAKNKKNII